MFVARTDDTCCGEQGLGSTLEFLRALGFAGLTCLLRLLTRAAGAPLKLEPDARGLDRLNAVAERREPRDHDTRGHERRRTELVVRLKDGHTTDC